MGLGFHQLFPRVYRGGPDAYEKLDWSMGTCPLPVPTSHPHPQTDKEYSGDRCQSESSERNWKEVRDRRTRIQDQPR